MQEQQEEHSLVAEANDEDDSEDIEVVCDDEVGHDDEGHDDDEVGHDATETTCEKPRNLPASVHARRDAPKCDDKAAEHESPVAQFGTRKRLVPFDALYRLNVCFYGSMLYLIILSYLSSMYVLHVFLT